MAVWYALQVAAVAAGVMTPPAVSVLFPTNSFLSALPDDTAILTLSTVSITLVSEHPDLVQRLYGAGAWIVLPADLTGCLPR